MARIAIMAFALLVLGTGCMKNDCGNPDNNTPYRLIESVLLVQKAEEDGPSARWYWCEAPMRKRGQVPSDMLGPLVNLFDGSDYGYGRWIQVSAGDAETFTKSTWIYHVLPEGDGGAALAWRYAAAARFAYQYSSLITGGWVGGNVDTLEPRAAEMFASYVRARTRHHAKQIFPGGVRCYSVPEVQERAEDSAECRTPVAKSPVGEAGDTTSSSASGGTSPNGDQGPN